MATIQCRRAGLTSIDEKRLLRSTPGLSPSDVEVLDVAENEINALTNLTRFRNLHTLNLSCNSVALLRCLPSTLVSLSVSRNSLYHLSGLDQLPLLEFLDVSRNKITQLTSLVHLRRLRVLNAAHNQIKTTEGVESLILLEELDLEFNHIEDNEDVRCLSLNKQLRALQLRANPLARAQFYRVSVVHMLPQLLELDGVPVHGSLAASGAGATHHLARSAPVGGASRGSARSGARAGAAVDASGVLNSSTRTNVELDPMLAQWMAREMLHGLPAASPGNPSSAAAALDGEPASKQLLGVPDMPRRAGSAGQAAGRSASPLPPVQAQQPQQLSASFVRQSSAVPGVTYEGTGVRYTGPRQSVAAATAASTAASRNDSAHAASHRLNASGTSAASSSFHQHQQHRDAPHVGIVVSRASADTSALQQSGLNASSAAPNPPSYLSSTYASTRRAGAPSAPMAAAHSVLSASTMSAASAAGQSSAAGTLQVRQQQQQQQQQRSHSASRARPVSASLGGGGALGAASVSPARRSLSAQRTGGGAARSTSTGSALSASSRVTTTFATSSGAARVVGTGHRASDALTRMQIDSEELTQRVSSLYAEVVGAGLPPDSAVPPSTQHSAAARLSQSDPSGFGGAGVMRGRVTTAPSTGIAGAGVGAAVHPPALNASHSQRSLPRSASVPGSSGAASADADLASSTRVYIEGQLDRHRTVLSELAQHSASASASAQATGAASLPSFDNRVLSIAELLAVAASSGFRPGTPLRWLHEDAGASGTPQPPASSSSTTSASVALRTVGMSPSGLPPMAGARVGSPLRNSPSGAQLLAAPSTMSLAGSSVSVHSASGSSVVSPSATSIQGGASRGGASGASAGDEVARVIRKIADALTEEERAALFSNMGQPSVLKRAESLLRVGFSSTPPAEIPPPRSPGAPPRSPLRSAASSLQAGAGTLDAAGASSSLVSASRDVDLSREEEDPESNGVPKLPLRGAVRHASVAQAITQPVEGAGSSPRSLGPTPRTHDVASAVSAAAAAVSAAAAAAAAAAANAAGPVPSGSSRLRRTAFINASAGAGVAAAAPLAAR